MGTFFSRPHRAKWPPSLPTTLFAEDFADRSAGDRCMKLEIMCSVRCYSDLQGHLLVVPTIRPERVSGVDQHEMGKSLRYVSEEPARLYVHFFGPPTNISTRRTPSSTRRVAASHLPTAANASTHQIMKPRNEPSSSLTLRTRKSSAPWWWKDGTPFSYVRLTLRYSNIVVDGTRILDSWARIGPT